jgi:hypothetical protein
LTPVPGCYRHCSALPPGPHPRTVELRAPAHLFQRWRPSWFRESVPSPYVTLVAPRRRPLFQRSRRLLRSMGPQGRRLLAQVVPGCRPIPTPMAHGPDPAGRTHPVRYRAMPIPSEQSGSLRVAAFWWFLGSRWSFSLSSALPLNARNKESPYVRSFLTPKG